MFVDPTGEFIVSSAVATYVFVLAPVAARYGPVVARAARSGYARVAPAASRAGQAVMNFAQTHPITTNVANNIADGIASYKVPGPPLPSPGGYLGSGIRLAQDLYNGFTSQEVNPKP